MKKIVIISMLFMASALQCGIFGKEERLKRRSNLASAVRVWLKQPYDPVVNYVELADRLVLLGCVQDPDHWHYVDGVYDDLIMQLYAMEVKNNPGRAFREEVMGKLERHYRILGEKVMPEADVKRYIEIIEEARTFVSDKN